MIRVSKQQRRNALEARDKMWPSVPSENVVRGLRMWRTDGTNTRPDCDTVACFGGWCVWWPSFRRQGARADADGMPYIKGGNHGTVVAHILFGQRELFYPRGDHPADPKPRDQLEYFDPAHITDHELVRRRLDWLIANSEVVE